MVSCAAPSNSGRVPAPSRGSSASCSPSVASGARLRRWFQLSFSASHMSTVSAVRTARALRRAASKQDRMPEGMSGSKTSQWIDRLGVRRLVLRRRSRPRAPRRGEQRLAIRHLVAQPGAQIAAMRGRRRRGRAPVAGALGVAGEPEEVVGGAAEHQAQAAWDWTGMSALSGLVVEDPGVLGAAALARIDHQRALLQRHPGQPAGDDADPFAPDSTKGRKSTWRGAMPLSTKVGQVDSASVGWAM